MSNRNAASLTGSLLVRKGAATPSPLGRGAGIDGPSSSRFTAKLAPEPSQGAPSPVALPAANDKPAAAVRKNGEPDHAPARAGPSAPRRFTLRLSPDQHLRLRLASVHLGRSGQKLVLQAVNEYLGRIAPELREGNCACILDGAVAPPPRGGKKPAR